LNKQKNIILKGSTAGRGIAKGYAFVIDNSAKKIKEFDSTSTQKIQQKKYHAARGLLKKEFEQIKMVLGGDGSSHSSRDSTYYDIFETNILMLDDPELSGEIDNYISQGKTAEFAVASSFDIYISKLLATGNQYLKDRSEDLIHLRALLIDYILKDSQQYSLGKEAGGGIAVMNSVSTRDIYNFQRHEVAGIVSQKGGLTSHAVILARAFNIPMIVGVQNALKKIDEGDLLVLNCDEASVCLNPDNTFLEDFEKKNEKFIKREEEILSRANENKAGKNIDLLLNVDFPEEIEEIHRWKASGVGLLRTESIFGSKDLNDEDYQAKVYGELAEKTFPEKLNIRLFDIGNDKLLGNFSSSEQNPALGQRGIRFLKNNPNLISTQLRAIFRASQLGNIKITIPMLTNLGDIIWFKKFIANIESELSNQKIEYKRCEIGIMLEIPSVAFGISSFAQEIDFVSIGTNDLAQYFFAADRNSDLVAGYYDYYDPAFLKFLNFAVSECKLYDVPVSICGEMAADLDFVPLLVAMGVDALSVSASLLPDVKECVLGINSEDKLTNLLEKVLNSKSSKVVKKLLRNDRK
jgi:phosphoenolpyruvate-protein phosphotransferase (PTS system enzyme I)